MRRDDIFPAGGIRMTSGAMRFARPSYATSSRRGDRIAMVALCGVLLLGLPATRVYFRVTVAELEITRLNAQGDCVSLPIPSSFEPIGPATLPPERMLPRVESQIRDYMDDSNLLREGDRIEWTIRYSLNSPSLDQKVVYVFQAP